MADSTSNDNDVDRADGHLRGPDPNGQAAILLVESLIHGLIARSVISVADALEIVDVAADVKEEITLELGATYAEADKSLIILKAIGESLAHDLPYEEGAP